MKLLILFVCCASVVTARLGDSFYQRTRHKEPPPPISDKKVNTKSVYEGWITQKLDHFNTSDRRSFQMRYYGNSEFYESGGPLFIYVGGEWAISEGWLTSGHMVDMAREMNGYIFYTEHRFYGETRPTTDLSVDSLKYLDIDQALEDLVHFIRFQKSILDGAQNSGVILVGASYSATMVSWFRQRYPDLVNGVWASSAPLFAKVDFFEYKEVAGRALNIVMGNEQCSQRINRAFIAMEAAIDAGQIAKLEVAFNTCTNGTIPYTLDVWRFFDGVSEMIAGHVQTHYIQSTTIQDACIKILDATVSDDIEAFAAWFRDIMKGDCFDHTYFGMIDYFTETSWTSQVALDSYRQWYWQTCQEYGWYQTLSSDDQPFGTRLPVEFNLGICKDAYENYFTAESVAENVERTNHNNLGLEPNFTRVFSTHGQLDPWSAMGLKTAPNADSPVVTIPMASHCNDLYSISSADSVEMRDVKEQIKQRVIEWLKTE